MRFFDTERQQALILQLQSPAWTGIEHLFNPEIPHTMKLNTRSLFATNGCFSSSNISLNLKLLKLLQCSTAEDIRLFDGIFPIEREKDIKYFSDRYSFFHWLQDALDKDLGNLCSRNFVLIKPYNEDQLLEDIQLGNLEPRKDTSPSLNAFFATYWLAAWQMAAAYPLNTELNFGLSDRIVNELREMDVQEIMQLLNSDSASHFQIRHPAVLWHLLDKYREEKNSRVLRLLQDYRILQEIDEYRALGFNQGMPIAADTRLLSRFDKADQAQKVIEEISNTQEALYAYDLYKEGLDEKEIAQRSHMDEDELKYLIGVQARNDMYRVPDCSEDILNLFLSKFFLQQMDSFGVYHYWSYDLLRQTFEKKLHQRKVPLSVHLATKQFQQQINLGLVNQEYSHTRKMPLSTSYAHFRYFQSHLKRISVVAFLLLYTRIGTSNTMKYVDYRSMIIALEKQKALFDKKHYRDLGIFPLSPDQAFFVANEWREHKISLNYCPHCGQIFATPNIEKLDKNPPKVLKTRLSVCPFCIMLRLDDNFDSPQAASDIRESLKTNYEILD